MTGCAAGDRRGAGRDRAGDQRVMGARDVARVRLRKRARSGDPVATPVFLGDAAPHAEQAAAAGFLGRAGEIAALDLPSGRHWLVGLGPGAAPGAGAESGGPAVDTATATGSATGSATGPATGPATGLTMAPAIGAAALSAAEQAGALAAAAAEDAAGMVGRRAGATTTARVALDARQLAPAIAAAFAAGACLRGWRYDVRTRSRTEPPRFDLLVQDRAAVAAAWQPAAASVQAALFARELTAEPANRLTPGAFANRLEALAGHGIAVDVFGRKRLERTGFAALLAVGRASRNPPRLAVLRWRGSFAAPPVVLVGKGICFDAGGLAIKPAAGMEAMRGDMAGAAACAGAMLGLALRRSPAPVVAVLPLAENLPGADAYRAGDVLRLRSGRTVEIVDPDAEGRLVLAEALDFAAGLRPRAIVDLGTLTGATVVALGQGHAALFGNDLRLADDLRAAGAMVSERLWPLPIGAAHRADLRSDIADLRQCASGRGQPDACHAAAFLEAFVPANIPWAHLDIAGVAQAAEATPLAAKGPTGFGARLLDRLIADRFERPD